MPADRGPGLVDRAWAAVMALLGLALGVRVAASWLEESWPLLAVLGALTSVFWLLLRARAGRRPWDGSPWP